MKKEKVDKQLLETKVSTAIMALVVAFVALHTVYLIVNAPSVPGESPSALSGLATGRLGWVQDQYSTMSPQTKMILAAEWMLVIFIALFSLIRGRMRLNKELKKVDIKGRSKFHKEKPETDIDVLYEMLQKDKSIRLGAIGKIFGVNTKTALEWCRILESCDLAEIHYPTVGDPKIILNEPKENNVEKPKAK